MTTTSVPDTVALVRSEDPSRATFPDTPVGRRAEELVGLLCAGDRQAIANFVTESYAREFQAALRMEQHVAVYEMILRDYPMLELRSMGELSETKLEAYLESTGNQKWLKLFVVVVPDSPYLVAGIRFLGLGASPPPRSESLRSEVLSPAGKREFAAIIATLMERHYVHAEVGKKASEFLGKSSEDGSYDAVATHAAFAAQLTRDLQSISVDKHIRVFATSRASAMPLPRPANATSNAGYERSEVLRGNIGYIDLRAFKDVPVAQSAAREAMQVVQETDAVIFDLRNNGGGSPEGVQCLCSYLFAERTHLNSLYWRADDRTEEYWTLEEVAGKKRPHVPVFVLTSSRTFSAAEEFAYNLQMQKRATIVGAITGGGANPGCDFELGPWMSMFISTGMAINPVSKTNWEGVGVKPDVECDEEEALEKALELAREAKEFRPR